MMMTRIKKILGFPRERPVTHLNVTPAEPEPVLEKSAREATARFVEEKWAAERSAEEIRRRLASGALKLIVQQGR